MRRPRSIPAGRWASVWERAKGEVPAELEGGTAHDLLERFVLNLRAADEALAEAQKEPFVTGSQGQSVDHPGFRVAARCDGVALSLAKQLSLGRVYADSDSDTQEDEPGFDELAARRAG